MAKGGGEENGKGLGGEGQRSTPLTRHWIPGPAHNCSLTDEQTKEVEEGREEGVMTRLDPLPQASPSGGRKDAEGLGN